jgi:microcin C transport system permease protein
MRAYFLRRLLLVVPTLAGVTLLVFLVTRFAPGGPVEQAIMRAQSAENRMGASAARGGPGGGALSEEQLAQLKAYFGYDKPPLVAYGHWLAHLFQGDLGNSFRYGEPVSRVIADAMPVTLTYGVLSLLITYCVSVPLSILKAMRHRTLLDTSSSVLIFLGYAIPGYAMGALPSPHGQAAFP